MFGGRWGSCRYFKIGAGGLKSSCLSLCTFPDVTSVKPSLSTSLGSPPPALLTPSSVLQTVFIASHHNYSYSLLVPCGT